jgi:hypothetical protein
MVGPAFYAKKEERLPPHSWCKNFFNRRFKKDGKGIK